MRQPSLFPPASLSVSEITRYVRDLMDVDEVLKDVTVRGEISNLSRPASGHIYFTLKDSGAALKCAMWKSSAARLRLPLQNGLMVEAHGAIGVYERDGVYQLYATAIHAAGEGLLYQEFLRLKNQLEEEGLFDPEHKRPLPERPRGIGIVTSATGAALQDMLTTLRRRYPLARVVLAPTAVQGDEAPPQLVAALRALARLEPPEQVDVILLARGGGSLEDLWAFNDERVVRAVAASPIPIISGVGHETDFTLVDFAADQRAPTPTAAAELATPDRAELEAELQLAYSRLVGDTLNRLRDLRAGFEMNQRRLSRVTPARELREQRQRLDDWSERLARATRRSLAARRLRLAGIAARQEALNPLAVLRRGYALVRDAEGRLVSRAAALAPGQPVSVQLSDGRFDAEVRQLHPDS